MKVVDRKMRTWKTMTLSLGSKLGALLIRALMRKSAQMIAQLRSTPIGKKKYMKASLSTKKKRTLLHRTRIKNTISTI